jgi:hypothetical protein
MKNLIRQHNQERQMGKAHLIFTDNADGTLGIDARHNGGFDPALQSHACLRAVSQFLPQVLGAAGTRVDGATGTRMPIDDGERYQALRALALLEDKQAAAIARLIGQDRGQDQDRGHDHGRDVRGAAEYDALVDRLVEIVRGVPQ